MNVALMLVAAIIAVAFLGTFYYALWRGWRYASGDITPTERRFWSRDGSPWRCSYRLRLPFLTPRTGQPILRTDIKSPAARRWPAATR